MRKSIVKIELPLDSDAAFADLVESFEACTLPYENWTHRAHLAMALFYVRNMSHESAVKWARERINAYNLSCGNLTGYNETVTQLYLMKLRHDAENGRAMKELPEELERVARAYGVGWIYRFYSKDRIWSPEAAVGWVVPDLRSLDFFPNSTE